MRIVRYSDVQDYIFAKKNTDSTVLQAWLEGIVVQVVNLRNFISPQHQFELFILTNKSNEEINKFEDFDVVSRHYKPGLVDSFKDLNAGIFEVIASGHVDANKFFNKFVTMSQQNVKNLGWLSKLGLSDALNILKIFETLQKTNVIIQQNLLDKLASLKQFQIKVLLAVNGNLLTDVIASDCFEKLVSGFKVLQDNAINTLENQSLLLACRKPQELAKVLIVNKDLVDADQAKFMSSRDPVRLAREMSDKTDLKFSAKTMFTNGILSKIDIEDVVSVTHLSQP